jgi:hypothetical protein
MNVRHCFIPAYAYCISILVVMLPAGLEIVLQFESGNQSVSSPFVEVKRVCVKAIASPQHDIRQA